MADDILGPNWLRETVDKAVIREKQIANSHRCRCHLRDPGADDVEPGDHQNSEQK